MTDTNNRPGGLVPELSGAKPATAATRQAIADNTGDLDFSDRTSFENAARGFLASMDPVRIVRERDKKPVFDLTELAFLEGEATETVNPSLWRQAQLNALHHGLFEVVDGIYQVRSYDLANMTLIRGDTGWVLIDPLTCAETSRAALELANQHLGHREVKAVVHTHSHADHFGGVYGVVSPGDIATGKVAVLAPEGYVEEALHENVLAGNVMGRRATYMFGNLLEPSPEGFVGNGLGAALAMGTTGFAVPTDFIGETGETRTLDGVEFEFMMTPGTEAPVEMVFLLPQFAALCMAEITSHHLHNVYTPRGAQVRDALAWAQQIDEAIDRFGDRLEVQFGCHHWPTWGRSEALGYMRKQRDLYKYIHDQTLRLANQGYTIDEVAERVRLPDSLRREFYNRDYYGTVHHNTRAVYVKYLGFFDGNPANLAPLEPSEAGARYVEFMGGADEVVAKAQASFDAGDYRWVAEVLNHVVMSEPHHQRARALCADALEQLGYQAESGPWRNIYLSGAKELREGTPRGSSYRASEGMARGMPLEHLFQALAVRVDGPAAEGLHLVINVHLTEPERDVSMVLENSVLHAWIGRVSDAPGLAIRASELDFKRLMLGLADPAELAVDGRVLLEGDQVVLAALRSVLVDFERRFPIVLPR